MLSGFTVQRLILEHNHSITSPINRLLLSFHYDNVSVIVNSLLIFLFE